MAQQIRVAGTRDLVLDIDKFNKIEIPQPDEQTLNGYNQDEMVLAHVESDMEPPFDSYIAPVADEEVYLLIRALMRTEKNIEVKWYVLERDDFVAALLGEL